MEEGKHKLEAKEFATAEKTFASGKLGRISHVFFGFTIMNDNHE